MPKFWQLPRRIMKSNSKKQIINLSALNESKP